MPVCPVRSGLILEGPCPHAHCHNNVPTLDYHCLPLHGAIYGKKPTDILSNLYGKPYKMTVALAIKASRIAYTIKNLTQQPDRAKSPFEGSWCAAILAAGPLDSRLHWTELTQQNSKYKFIERMRQVLNTMEVHEYPLFDVLQSYKDLFTTLDYAALAIPEGCKKDVEELFRRMK